MVLHLRSGDTRGLTPILQPTKSTTGDSETSPARLKNQREPIASPSSAIPSWKRSTEITLSATVENRFGTQNVEVINLGVSATDPDEYYYRIRNIATKLDIDHCVLFLYAGNDFSAPARTLPTTAGIAAVYPRGSLLSSLGMHSLNHILTNKRRPVLQTWFSGGDLLAAETRLAKAFADADYQGIRDCCIPRTTIPEAPANAAYWRLG